MPVGARRASALTDGSHFHLFTEVQHWMNGTARYTSPQDEYDRLVPYLKMYNPNRNIPKHTWSGVMGESVVKSILDYEHIDYSIQPRVISGSGKVKTLDFSTSHCLIEVRSQRYTSKSTLCERLPHTVFQLDGLHDNRLKIIVLMGAYEQYYHTYVLKECPEFIKVLKATGVFVVNGSSLQQDVTWLDGLDECTRKHRLMLR
jgi:hypothetical protein